jgi:hypothetical protein
MDKASWLATRGGQVLDLSKTTDAAPTLDRKPSDEPDPTNLN